MVTSLDYDYIRNQVSLYKLTTDLHVYDKTTIRTEYLPVTHDYLVYGDRSECMMFCDAPFIIRMGLFWKGQIPIVLDLGKPTYIHSYNFTDGVHRKWKISERGHYIFHFSNICQSVSGNLTLYASVYDEMNFNSVDICGKYRRIELSGDDCGVGVIMKNDEIEGYNLDFPVLWNNTVILRNIETSVDGRPRINGFLFIDGFRVIQKLFYDDIGFCGEPAVCYDGGGRPFLLSFAYNDLDGWLVMIDLTTFERTMQKIPVIPMVGFHSVFF
jgi:hypothetical protein